MKKLLGTLATVVFLAGCISNSNPNEPPSTVAQPPLPGTTVGCDNGNPPPCD